MTVAHSCDEGFEVRLRRPVKRGLVGPLVMVGIVAMTAECYRASSWSGFHWADSARQPGRDAHRQLQDFRMPIHLWQGPNIQARGEDVT
jgi:hypothetical protein